MPSPEAKVWSFVEQSCVQQPRKPFALSNASPASSNTSFASSSSSPITHASKHNAGVTVGSAVVGGATAALLISAAAVIVNLRRRKPHPKRAKTRHCVRVHSLSHTKQMRLQDLGVCNPDCSSSRAPGRDLL